MEKREIINEVDILIVEDNQNDAELALRALKQNNIANKVLIINDGRQALDFIFARGEFAKRKGIAHPKIILLDLKLPRIDGLEVLREIKSNPDTKIIPVIVLSSSREKNDIVQSYRLCANSYIVKPVDYEEFVETIRDLGIYWLKLNQQP